MHEEVILFKENKVEVLKRLKDGRVDYVDLTSWSFQDRLFGFLLEEKFFAWCASSYPTPRERENIPVWFLLACAIQMKLHRSAAFKKLEYILRSGSILTRVNFNIGLQGGGFNDRNRKERTIPIDQDTARKFFTDTEASHVEDWYNGDVQQWLRRHRGYSDKEGIFILDPTVVCLPDNPHYKESALLPLDREGNYVDVKKLSPAERKKFKYTRAYKVTLLLHWSRQDEYFLFAGGHLGKGNESGLKEGEALVDRFVAQVGKGVVKLLIMDREFIDGAMIGRFKKSHGIDCLVPLKSNMHALLDALGIAKLEKLKWMTYHEVKDEQGKVIEAEEVAAVGNIASWDSCAVPLSVVLVRTRNREGSKLWALASTKEYRDPRRSIRAGRRSRSGSTRSRTAGGWAALRRRTSMPMRSTLFSSSWSIRSSSSTSRQPITRSWPPGRSSHSSRKSAWGRMPSLSTRKSTLASLTLMSLSKSFLISKHVPARECVAG